MTKTLITGALGLLGFGFTGHEYLTRNYAPLEDVLVAESQLQYIYQRQEEAIVRQIAALEREQARLGKLTPAQMDLLNDLRAQLKEMREVRKGK